MKQVLLKYLRSMLPFRWVLMLLYYIAYKLIIWVCLPSSYGMLAVPAVILTDLIGGIGRTSPLLNWIADKK